MSSVAFELYRFAAAINFCAVSRSSLATANLTIGYNPESQAPLFCVEAVFQTPQLGTHLAWL